MPTETKNVALKRIWSGRISPSACWLKRLSLTTRPARKAPSDRLTPARLVRNAVPRQMAMTVSRKSSGEQVRATCSSTIGIRRRAISSTATMIAPALPSAQTISAPSRRAAEHRHQQHHHDDREVLEDRGCRARSARAASLVSFAVGEQLEHDRGRAERDQEAGEEPAPPVDAEDGSSRSSVPSVASTTWSPPPREDGRLHLAPASPG